MQSKAFFNRCYLQSAIVIALLSISACATTGGSADQEKLDLAKYSTVTSHDAVTSIESTYHTTDINELATYAPDHYSTAGKAIEDAKALLSKSQPREKIVQKVAVAEAMLRNGDRVMQKVKDILEPEISIKQKLDMLNTKNAYAAEYGSLNERLNKIIREIEAGNNTDEQNREKLLKDMQHLERKSLRYNAMNEPQEILKRVKYSGGEQLAPITYGEAVAVFKRAEEFIKQNPDYEVGIAQMGREALFAAKRALYITEGVSSLKQKVAFAPEQVILDEEYRMYRVARQLADLDYRDNSLEVQSELLAKEAESIAIEMKNKDDLVIALRDTLIKVRDSSSRLTMLSESTQKLKKEKNAWLAKEALFKAKVAQLEENLKKTEMQLDSTQQTLLAIKSDNNKLAAQAKLTEQNTLAGKTKPQTLNTNKPNPAENESSITASAIATKEEQQPAPMAETEIVKKVTTKPAVIPESNPKPVPQTFVKTESKPAFKEVMVSKPVEKVTSPDTLNKLEIQKEAPIKSQPALIASEPNVAPTPATALISEDSTQKNTNDAVAKTQSTDERPNEIEKIESKAVSNEPLITEITSTPPPEPTERKKVEATSKSDTESEDTLAVLAKKKNPPKVTEQETLDALRSAKELIKSLEATEVKLVDKTNTEAADDISTDDGFLEEESDAFVDASE